MFKVEERKIGDSTYKVSQLGAIKGRSVMLRLTKCLGPALVGLASRETLKASIPDLLANMDIEEEDLTYFCDSFAEKTFVVTPDGKMPRLDNVFDLHFAGRYMEMIQWLGFCLEVNYAGFFRGAADRVAAAQPSAPAVTAPTS